MLVIVSVGLGACSSEPGSGFCDEMRRPRDGFADLGAPPDRAFLDAFDDLAAQVPADLEADFAAVRRIAQARAEPSQPPTAQELQRFFAATTRIDGALERRCGIAVRNAPNLFERLDRSAAPTTGARP